MKRWLWQWIVIAAATLLLPWLAVTFAPGDAGMAACFLLFFGVNPLLALAMGVIAGRQKAWWQPVAAAGMFLLGAWLNFEMGETAFLLYAGAYLAIGLAAMGLTRIISKER